jgi:hypothetical protein
MATTGGDDMCTPREGKSKNMIHGSLLVSLLVFLLSSIPAWALTTEEILALKKAEVSDETLQRLLEQEHEDKLLTEHLGTWTTPDGRVIRSTGKRQWSLNPPELHQPQYLIGVYPFIQLPPP